MMDSHNAARTTIGMRQGSLKRIGAMELPLVIVGLLTRRQSRTGSATIPPRRPLDECFAHLRQPEIERQPPI